MKKQARRRAPALSIWGVAVVIVVSLVAVVSSACRPVIVPVVNKPGVVPAPAVVPKPTVPTTPTVPPATATKWAEHLGVNIWLDEGQARQAKAAGFTWVRISWEQGWSDAGDVWHTPDQFIAYAHSQGLKVLEVCQKGDHRYAAGDVTSFAAWCSGWVDHGADAIEIGNEWNNATFFSTGSSAGAPANMALQAALTAATASAIRVKSSTIPVITNGWSPMGAPLDPPHAAHNLLGAKPELKNTITAVGHHPYTFELDPYHGGLPEHPEWNASYQTTQIWADMKAQGYANKQLWLTEFGLPSKDPTRPYINEAYQARQMTAYFAAFSKFRAEGVPIGVVFVYNLIDGNPGTGAPWEADMGLLHKDGTAKPAAAVVKAQAAKPW